MLPLLLACTSSQLTLGGDSGAPSRRDTSDTAAPDSGDTRDSATSIGPAPDSGGDDTGDTGDEDDVEQVIFDEGRITALSLSLTDDAERSLRRDPTTFVEATLGYEDRTWEVAIRIKGSSTYTDLTDKPSLVVDINRVVADQEFMDLKRFNLHNQLIDPSMMSEVMSYRYLRDAGLPASRVGYVRLTLDGEDYGLYTAVEAINDDFLERWFTNPDGNLYENGWQDCDLDDFRCFEAEETDEGTDDALRDLVDDAGLEGDEWLEAMRARFDWDLFIRSLAMDALIAHWDGYAFDRSNYHLYHDPVEDAWTFIPQSMDLDYGWRPWSYDTCGRYGVDPGDYTEGLLGRKCLENETCRAEYRAELLRLNEDFEAADPVGRVDELYALIREDVYADDRKHYGDTSFERHVSCVRDWVEQRPDEIRAWVEADEAGR